MAILLAAVGALSACGGYGSTNPTSPTSSASPTTPTSAAGSTGPTSSTGAPPGAGVTVDELRAGTEWQGTFSITLEVWDYCASPEGSLELSHAETYTRTESFSFATAGPLEDEDGLQETNPFYLSAGTQPNDPGTVQLTIFSAGLLAVEGSNQQPFLHQYWELRYTGGRINGELVDDARPFGFDNNRFYDASPNTPCQPELGMLPTLYPMQEGATMLADIGEREMTMVVEGRSHDDARRFRIEASATRS